MKTKGRELAELLRDIMAESEAFGGGEVTEESLQKTAEAIQADIDKGELEPDEQGMYYHIYMVDEYGGLFEKDLDNAPPAGTIV